MISPVHFVRPIASFKKIQARQPLNFNGYSGFVTRFLSYKPNFNDYRDFYRLFLSYYSKFSTTTANLPTTFVLSPLFALSINKNNQLLRNCLPPSYKLRQLRSCRVSARKAVEEADLQETKLLLCTP